tara:strand:+ start:968 stop:1723 length:756 start_codon:yes stop_codon:yes gene_type:complete
MSKNPRPHYKGNELAEYMEDKVMPDFLKNRIYDLFKIVKKYLDEADAKWWASGGTLLGAVRHKGLIPWDDDLDIDVDWTYTKDRASEYQDTYEKALRLMRADNRLKVMEYGAKTNAPSMAGAGHIVYFKDNLEFQKKHNIKGKNKFYPSMDINKIKQGERMMNYNWIIPQSGPFHDCVFMKKEIYPLKSLPFGDTKINIPNQWKPYIRRCYTLKSLKHGVFTHTHHPYEKLKPKDQASFKIEDWNKIKHKI